MAPKGLRLPAPIERLPAEIQFEIFQHLLYLTPSPVGRYSDNFKRGYHVRIFARSDETQPDSKDAEEKVKRLGERRYLHPFVALKVTSKILNNVMESFCGHLLETKKFGIREDVKPGTMRSRQSNTFHFIEMLWTKCAYCTRKSKKKGIIATYLHLCSACDRKEFPKLTLTDSKKVHKLTVTELDDPRNRIRKGYYMVHGTPTTMYLEKDIMRYLDEQKRGGRVMLPGNTMEDRIACREALRAGLSANGLQPIIRGIGHQSLSLGEYDALRHTPLLKTRTVAEVVRMQYLLERVCRETCFMTCVLPHFMQYSESDVMSSCRSQHFRRSDAPAIRNIDVFNLGLYLLYLREFRGINTALPTHIDGLIQQYKAANRPPYEDQPWHLSKYPVYFKQPEIPPGTPHKYRHLYYTLYPSYQPLMEAKKTLLEEQERNEQGQRHMNLNQTKKLEMWMKSGSW